MQWTSSPAADDDSNPFILFVAPDERACLPSSSAMKAFFVLSRKLLGVAQGFLHLLFKPRTLRKKFESGV